MTGRLEGKTAIVTGAASGMGLATARRFVAEGARVVMADVNEAGVGAAARALGEGAISIGIDVADPIGVAAMVSLARKSFGKIDALTHYAGMIVRWEPTSLEAWDEVLRVNLTGSFVVAQAVAGEMVAAGGGSIVLVASRGHLGVPGQPGYAASKGGVVSLMRTLALELGQHNVRVNALAPGFIETPLSMLPGRAAQKAAEAPLKRTGLPGDIAAVALFLAGDESSFLTGNVMYVDGGCSVGLVPV